MLVIRMQRTGRKGHAQFRVVVQDARRTPTSGRVVAFLGNFDPHTKTANLDKEKVSFYLEHGAQPSERVARLLKAEGIKLPKWVKLDSSKNKRAIRNPEKLRKNRLAGTEAPKPKEETDEPVEQVEESPAEAKEPAKELTGEEPATEKADAEAQTPDESPENAESEPDAKKQK